MQVDANHIAWLQVRELIAKPHNGIRRDIAVGADGEGK
jgi:hypothetical protein